MEGTPRAEPLHPFQTGAESEAGHLVGRPGGSWAFHYDIRGDEDDAAGFRFENESFVPGEYVSTYIVASVEKF